MMETNIATTPEQSQRLIACGVDPNTADMGYEPYFDGVPHHLSVGSPFYDRAIPAWSLSALLALMPNRILVDDVWYECQICLCYFGYEVRYHSEVFKDPFGCLCKNPIEGCVNAIEYLTQNGYELKR